MVLGSYKKWTPSSPLNPLIGAGKGIGGVNEEKQKLLIFP